MNFMKKILLIVFIFLLSACTQSSSTIEVNTYDIDSLCDQYGSIVGVDEEYIYINDLDTIEDPFLFNTHQLLILDHDGQLVKKIPTPLHKRVVDFTYYHDVIYYFNIVSDNEYYTIELCQFDDHLKEVLIATYSISSPFLSPEFIRFNDNIYFKINHDLYALSDAKNPIYHQDSEWSVPSRTYQTGNRFYFTTISNQQQQICFLENGKTETLDLKSNIFNFFIDQDKIYYYNLEDHLLRCYNIHTQKEDILFKDILVVDMKKVDDILVITSRYDTIYFIDLPHLKVLTSFEMKNDLHSLNWIHQRGTDIYLEGDQKIIHYCIKKSQ